MAITKVGIVYSAGQQVIRRIIHPHASDSELDDVHANDISEGEVFVKMDAAAYNTHNCPQGIHTYLGLSGIPGISDRHFVIGTNNTVVAIVLGDPACGDAHCHGHMVCAGTNNNHVEIGWHYNNGTFSQNG